MIYVQCGRAGVASGQSAVGREDHPPTAATGVGDKREAVRDEGTWAVGLVL